MTATAPPPRARWIHGPVFDVAVALLWVPFAIAAHRLEGDRAALNALLAGVLLLSFSHQPLTLAFVYGDPEQFRLCPRVFTWAPLVFAGAVVVGSHVSVALVAVVAGLWNAEHTLMQRYGVTRIYGRKAGDDHGGLEKAMLISWLGLALVWAAADTRMPRFLARVDLGDTNARGVELLHALRPYARWALLPLAVVVAVLVVEWARAERRAGARVNPAKHLYVGSTAALFALMLVDPIAGLTGYVASHALEYFAIVHRTLGGRYRAAAGGGLLGRAVRLPTGTLGFLFGYVVAIAALVTVLQHAVSPVLSTAVVLTLGGMHVFYDGFIWKLRRPAVAGALDVPVVPPTRTRRPAP